MLYTEYQEKRQKEFNALPIFWAFSEKQFAEAMEERGLTKDDTDQIYSLGMGGYYLRSDADVIREYFNGPDELRELMNEREFAESAFYYEMQNHEYHINWQGDWDVCNCFGSCEYEDGKSGLQYLMDMGYPINVLAAWQAARNRFMADADEWY